MQQSSRPDPSAFPRGIVVLEAQRGQSRRRVLEEWVDRARGGGAAAWLLPCDVRETGLWAGVNTLVREVLPVLEEGAPGRVDRYAIEINTVLPALRSRFALPETLTDSAEGAEAVRNYAVDRAYRIPHGIIDLLEDVHRLAPSSRWVVLCDDYDRAGVLVRRFFRELVRRRGEAFGLTLVLAVSPGGADEALQPFGENVAAERLRLDLPLDPVPPRSRAEMTVLARELERGIKEDFAQMEIQIPDLIRYWSESENPARAHVWQAFALGRYNHHGFYEDALAYAGPVLEHLDEIASGVGYFTRWNVVGSIFGCLVSIGQVERAYQVVKEEALEKIFAPADRARVCYVMSMLHARFLPERDMEKADAFLQEGLRELEKEGVRPDDRHFLRVFLNNGLALIRHRQGRAEEAVQLCHEGYAHLSEYLAGDKHRLHRSVLLYNIAQVYTATEEYDRAVEYFTATMALDPNYSEYYNERGNIFLKTGRFGDAIRDYEEAIRLSPPYPEVWTNLGQCYRMMGRLDEAAAAYSRALDLDPAVNLALAGRAQVLDELGRAEEALADYDAALVLHPAQPLLLANRAALRFEAGLLEEAAGDLDQAIRMAPGHPALYRNRAVALEGLGRREAAVRDLSRYLELVPAAPDRGEVEERIAAMQGAAALV